MRMNYLFISTFFRPPLNSWLRQNSRFIFDKNDHIEEKEEGRGRYSSIIIMENDINRYFSRSIIAYIFV